MKKIIPLLLLGVQAIINNVNTQTIETKVVNRIKVNENIVQQENTQNNENTVQNEKVNSTYTTRMTSFYPEEGEVRTGSGLEPKNFEVNDKGWYTYQGKLVVATATTYLANQGWYVGNGVHLRKYYNEITLTIDGVDYKAIVLDSCGNCMKTDRVDLYVSSVAYAKDTMITVKE